MKKSALIVIALVLCQYGFAQKTSNKTAAAFKKLAWIYGTWNRTNAKPGVSGYEQWNKAPGFKIIGTGVTMRGHDTVALEKLQIIIKDDAIFYVAEIKENKEPVYFKLTAITENGFVCENPEHDFPKKIAYQLEGDKIIASISGNGKSIPYLFERRVTGLRK